MRSKTRFQTVAWCAVALVLIGCVGCSRTDRVAPGFIQVDIETSPTALDPRYATDAISERIDELLFEPLVRIDADGGFAPVIAERVERTTDTEVLFHLHRNLHFSDGRPLTARDVKYTFDFVMDRANRSPKAGGLRQLASIEAIDDFTIRMTTRGPYAPALEMAMLGIVPDGTPGPRSRLSIAPPGSGPFQLRHFERDDRVVLDRNPTREVPNPKAIRGIVFKVVPDPTVRALELVEGVCDLAPNDIQADLLPYLRKRNGLDVITSSGTTYWYVTFNFRDPVLKDLRVRKAIALAIDREEIIRSYLRGTARIASGMLTPENWAYDGDVATYPYDPAQAKTLLAAAGFAADPSGKRDLVLTYKCAPEGIRMAEIIQAMLRRVGIEVRIRSNEWATFYDDMQRGNFDIAAMPWIGIRDPHHYLMVFDSRMPPPRGMNRGDYSNAQMDALVEAGDATLDQTSRKQIYAQVQKLAADDLPYVSLWWQDNVFVISHRVSGFRPYPNGSLLSLTDLEFPAEASQ